MINYQYIAEAAATYSRWGYKELEVEWWAPKDVVHITKPEEIKDREDFYLPLNDRVLVASAEQSFLALAKEGKMPRGLFFATTPCFRNEPVTRFSGKYFIKTELINTSYVEGTQTEDLMEMIEDARAFFTSIVPDPSLLELVKTPEGYDLEYGGIEIGSYGIRSCPYLNWVYGTGVAEPRLSTAIAAIEEKKVEWPLL